MQNNRRNIWVSKMNEIEFPENATKENTSRLIEIGSLILDKMPRRRRFLYQNKYLLRDLIRYLLSVVSYSLWVIPLVILANLGVLGELPFTPMQELPPHINQVIFLYFVLGMILSIYLAISKGSSFTDWIIYKVLRIIKPEYELFISFSTIAKHLVDGHRRKAIRGLRPLRKKLKTYTEVNSDLRDYLSSELSILKDTVSLGRLILYSEKSDSELAYFFLDSGLCFIHQNFSGLFSKVEELQNQIKSFRIEKPTRFERLVGFVKMSEYLKNLVLIVIIIISFILWLIFGLKFTFPSG